MYHCFTVEARKVMQSANMQVQLLNHEYIGTEHILLGLVSEGSGVAANVLKNLHIGLGRIRHEIESIVQSGPPAAQAPRVEKIVEYSIEEARNLNHTDVGTEHLLLALLRDQEGIAAQVLMNMGLLLEDVRKAIFDLLDRTISNDTHAKVNDAPSDVSARRDKASLGLREFCPTCGSQTVGVLSGWRVQWLTPQERAALDAGSAILGPGGCRHAPVRVCVDCAPLWREVHQLAIQEYERQLAKEDAIAKQDFSRAASIRDQQAEFHSRMAAVLDRLLGSEPQGQPSVASPRK